MLGRKCLSLLLLLGVWLALAQTKLCGDNKKSPSTTDKTFIEEALAETNRRRKEHGVDPLTISQELCEVSQAWVDTQATTGEWKHSKMGSCGENLFKGSGKNYKGSDPVIAWYDEVKKYDFDKATFQKGTGHFTALVWKGTKEMCISKKDAGGTVYVVANYHPAGNMIGAFKDNVFKKSGGSADGAAPSPTRSLPLLLLLLTPVLLRLLR